MIRDILKVKDRVAWILQKYPETRDCDKTLWIQYLENFHHLKETLGEAKFSVFKSLIQNNGTPTMESIRRVRQKYQECGKYSASPDTARARMRERKEIKQWSLEAQ